MKTEFSLLDLEEIVSRRAAAADGTSYTATLLAKGTRKCAQKLGEEATEAVIAAVSRDRAELTKEAADLLYHLLVVLHDARLPLAEVLGELHRRTAQSGLEEKAGRKKAAGQG
jgi:phosphoribosyl-ATP pyrophosphohydrolase